MITKESIVDAYKLGREMAEEELKVAEMQEEYQLTPREALALANDEINRSILVGGAVGGAVGLGEGMSSSWAGVKQPWSKALKGKGVLGKTKSISGAALRSAGRTLKSPFRTAGHGLAGAGIGLVLGNILGRLKARKQVGSSAYSEAALLARKQRAQELLG